MTLDDIEPCFGCYKAACTCGDAWKRFCRFARNQKWQACLPILAHNLAIGAALCAAFELGYSDAEDNALYYRHGYRLDGRWTPGCGKPNDWHGVP